MSAQIELTVAGKIAENQLLQLTDRYPGVKVDKYVFMPTHLHMIIIIENNSAGASPRPTFTTPQRRISMEDKSSILGNLDTFQPSA